MKSRTRNIKLGIAFLIILLISFVFIKYDIRDKMTFENFKENREVVRNFVETNYIKAVILYMITFIVFASLSIPSITVINIAGGFMFGAVLSTVYTDICLIIGATNMFWFSRLAGRDFIKTKFGKRIEFVNSEIKRHGKNYLMALRIFPGFPYVIINLACGITDMKYSEFILISAFGLIPKALIYSIGGMNLANINSPKDAVDPILISALIILALLSFGPVIYKKIKHKR